MTLEQKIDELYSEAYNLIAGGINKFRFEKACNELAEWVKSEMNQAYIDASFQARISTNTDVYKAMKDKVK